MVPGGFAGEATEMFHEGLRVPPVKIKKRGKDVEDVWKLMLANVRTPRYNYGDLRALIAAMDLGERRMGDLVAQIRQGGVPRASSTRLMDYSERRMRAEIARFPTAATGSRIDGGRRHRGNAYHDPGRGHRRRATTWSSTTRHLAAGAGRSTPRSAWPGRGVQRRAAPDRSDDSEEFRLLPADPNAGAARHDRECQFPGPVGRRQHRDPSAASPTP